LRHSLLASEPDHCEGAHVATSGLVDFHCHLDLYPDHAAAVAECEGAGIFTLTVTTTPRAWPRNRELAARTRHVRAALGLHPQLVMERSGELALWEEYLPDARYVGEVGLDAGPRYYRSLDLQKQVFERVLQACAHAGDKILTVHSVRTARIVLDMVEAHLPPSRGKVVLHWFTGSKAEVRRAVDLGCYFSINMEMFRNERHRSLIERIPIERILTESDGPFTQASGRPARPTDVLMSVELLARTRGIDPDAAAFTIRANLKRLVAERH
jgi:TatD DNase family protein